MGYALFFLAVVAACLLWSAAFTAAAARSVRPWLRRLLLAVAVLVPVGALVPWVVATGVLAFRLRLETNWFAPTLSCAVAVLIGAVWIVVAGLSHRADGAPVAARWPVVGLAGLFVIAKLVVLGILLILDNAVAAQAPYLRLEAASLMETHLPPVVTDTENAAPLYREAFLLLDTDPTTRENDSPLGKPMAADLDAPATVELLRRHAPTLDLLRQAADRDVCRFTRDWSRPAVDMLLPEIQSIRNAARLLSLAARREAADGDAAAALRDVARLGRMSRHAASEPILISGLVGLAIDAVALDTLADVLPACTPDDAEAVAVTDLVGPPPTLTGGFYGEEAWGIRMFAEVAEGQTLRHVLGGDGWGETAWMPAGFALLYRVFLLPADLAAYRRDMHRQQVLAAKQAPFAEVRRETGDLEAGLGARRPGLLTALILPALGQAQMQSFKAEARHAAGRALVAATRQRLAGGPLPDALDAIDRQWLPAMPTDPYTGTTRADREPLRSRSADGDLVVWSVGPDGEDDGGPLPVGAERIEGHDDIGLRLER